MITNRHDKDETFKVLIRGCGEGCNEWRSELGGIGESESAA